MALAQGQTHPRPRPRRQERDGQTEEPRLRILGIIRKKVLFTSRPNPITVVDDQRSVPNDARKAPRLAC